VRSSRAARAAAPSAPLLPAAALLLAAVLAAACGGTAEPRPPLRVASLLEPPSAEPRPLAADLAVGAEPLAVPVDVAAARVGRLRLRARGDAQLVRLAWRLAGERRFAPYRALSFPLRPDGEEHLYEVDLRREPYWTGQVVELRLDAAEGQVRIASLEAAGGGSGHRLTSLKGLTVPSLPGSRRIEVELPAELPPAARFETWLGLLPRFDRPRTQARFRAWIEPAGGGEPVSWLDETFRGSAEEAERGWRRVRRDVRVPAGGGRLVLETTARRDGQPLPDGSAQWGAPTLVPPGRVDGMNLLVVVIDTLRADVVGAYGGEGGLTPSLDALAARSARFEEMLAPSPWTLPSVATLLTGQPPQVHGAGRHVGDFAPTALGEALPTLASELARRGYHTAAVYNNIYLNPSFGLERGFDEYAWVEDDDEVIVDHALARLEELHDRRHFLFVHLFGPHHPYAPPAEACEVHARRFAPDYDGDLGCTAERRDVPTLDGVVPPPGDWRWIEGLYRAEVAHSDRQVGRLLDALEQMGLAEETVVVVVSDHGEAFFDRLAQLDEHGYVQADHGHTFFSELLRVPAFVHVPGRAPGVVPGAAELADVMPTALHLLGLTVPPLGGRDLAGRLDGAAATERPTLIADRLLYGPRRWSARRGPWKLVVPEEEAAAAAEEENAEEAPAPELYDLSAAAGETRDVAASHGDVVRDLRALAERELAEREALRRRLLTGDEDVLNSAYLEWNHITKLRALGYLK
jgi:arylsulfatase A-like enzyme